MVKYVTVYEFIYIYIYMPRYIFIREFSHKIIILVIMNKRDVIKILNDILYCINSQNMF